MPVAPSILVAQKRLGCVLAASESSDAKLRASGFDFPLVVKPVRDRGSQGVSLVENYSAFKAAIDDLFERGLFGSQAIVEQYLSLSSEELTVTVLARPASQDAPQMLHSPMVLPPGYATSITSTGSRLTTAQ